MQDLVLDDLTDVKYGSYTAYDLTNEISGPVHSMTVSLWDWSWTMTLLPWDCSHMNYDLTPVRLVSHEPSPYHCETDLMWTMTLALWDCSHVNYDLTAVRFGPTTGTAPAVLPSPFLTTISLAGNTETDAHHLQLLLLAFVHLHKKNKTHKKHSNSNSQIKPYYSEILSLILFFVCLQKHTKEQQHWHRSISLWNSVTGIILCASAEKQQHTEQQQHWKRSISLWACHSHCAPVN